ncbi:BZ3500_MvSof-1268-A1-R1_Chr2-2g04879 [Microbotryum saponariae]|uniref:Conserved oligomeric Golgi complex subunit 3 n=1 Tax=Microbotryum saponariae TaxID=289078 RepID=A0A2X0KWK8_9BASI|nr:BZ3500_MvSof-1268-A1-R1_Chr2-2g04879 [Microbotryum saponariae]SDA00387.1 BZ3501_MvSof-1269-A2-R1_Chr2-2g04553 [Microbotryum saponariae]
MSIRASTSRLSLEDWDQSCPLRTSEAALISRVQHASSSKPIPAQLLSQARSGRLNPNTNRSRPTTPSILRSAASHVSLTASPVLNRSSSPSTPPRPLHTEPTTPQQRAQRAEQEPTWAPITTTQQFHDWFALVERSLEIEQEQVYVNHLETLSHHLAACEHVLENLDDARGLLSEIEANYRFVEDNSRALQLACETMLDEQVRRKDLLVSCSSDHSALSCTSTSTSTSTQKHLIQVTEALSARLEYFRQLETATRMLNLPGEDLVLQEEFLNVLDRLDLCLDYLKANVPCSVSEPAAPRTTLANPQHSSPPLSLSLSLQRDFKDAEIYLIRFQQCLTRSMTLIKMYFVSTIKRLTTEVLDKMTINDLSETASHALLYTKFSTTAETLRILTYELEKRASVDRNEYGSLLGECYTVWFASRGQLLSAELQEEVRRMDPVTSDLIKLAKAGCNHLRSVCMAEWDLYKQLFATGEVEAYRFLESLCDYLYDSLRPRILHEPKLETLCELCTILGAMGGLDAEMGEDEEDDEVGGRGLEQGDTSLELRWGNQTASAATFVSPNSTTITPLGRLKFSKLLQTIQQDAQTRLVFRAQAVIQSEVLHYTPTLEDLDYPAKLLDSEGRTKDLALWTEDERKRETEGGGGAFRVPREEVQGDWYPTLKRTVWVLSKLNTYVNVSPEGWMGWEVETGCIQADLRLRFCVEQNAIFEDFAGEAVTLCRQSLSTAAAQIRSRPLPIKSAVPSEEPTTTSTNLNDEDPRQLDGQLFLIRHLLLLKEMIRSVDMVQIERAADFSTVTDALINLLRNTSVIFNRNALFELASRGIPSFTETMRDAKTDLDSALKSACEELIAETARTIGRDIQGFLDECGTYLSAGTTGTAIGAGAGQGKDLSSQGWASAERVMGLHDAFVGGVQGKVVRVAMRLKVYLNDPKTSAVLLPPLLDEILDTYSTFYNLIRSEYGFVTTSAMTTPGVVRDKLQEAVQQVA